MTSTGVPFLAAANTVSMVPGPVRRGRERESESESERESERESRKHRVDGARPCEERERKRCHVEVFLRHMLTSKRRNWQARNTDKKK